MLRRQFRGKYDVRGVGTFGNCVETAGATSSLVRAKCLASSVLTWSSSAEKLSSDIDCMGKIVSKVPRLSTI